MTEKRPRRKRKAREAWVAFHAGTGAVCTAESTAHGAWVRVKTFHNVPVDIVLVREVLPKKVKRGK